MASKYAKPLQVPTEFPDVLRSFTREVLRLQGKVETKEQIYEFGHHFFHDLLIKRDGASANLAAIAGGAGELPRYMKLSEEEIQTLLAQVFQEIDGEQSGVVGFDGLHQALAHVGETLEMSATELKALYAEADENDQGLIAYGGGWVVDRSMERVG
jgi:hypothetical protein